MNGKAVEELVQTMKTLLSPEGCPWDREQTHGSLTRYLIEETYEVIEAIDEGDMDKLREELGDLLLQVVFHAALADQAGHFDLDDVADTVNRKMISRHPHVFGKMEINTSDEVMQNWEGFKREEGKISILEGIPRMLPALLRAYKLQEKAQRVGFDWPHISGAMEKLQEEIDEFVAAFRNHQSDQIQDEMGDILFAVVNIARMAGVEPEQALQRCNDKFTRRFHYIEERLREEGKLLEEVGLERMDCLWDDAKKQGL
ncbi:MAG: nucleoside triphosphate pyrophosphohydrolase [Bacillota bacterium]